MDRFTKRLLLFCAVQLTAELALLLAALRLRGIWLYILLAYCFLSGISVNFYIRYLNKQREADKKKPKEREPWEKT